MTENNVATATSPVKAPKVKKTTKPVAVKQEANDGLRKPQVRILKALAKHGPLSRNPLAAKAKVGPNQVVGLTGSATPEARKSIETYHGYVSLITRGYVRDKVIDVDGVKERLFEITAAGKKSLSKIEAA